MNTQAANTHDIVTRLARAALHARALHCDAPATRLGSISLLPHQDAAVHWLHTRLTRHGGALLADPPGLGKTFVALAVAARMHIRPLVIALAALRDHWREAARRCDVAIDFVSTEQLSAPAEPRHGARALVIIDEAHHLRTPATRRHHRTAALCRDAQVLLLSATPIHNHSHDLARITRLFHLPASAPVARLLRQRLTLRRTLDDIRAAWPDPRVPVSVPVVRQRGTLALATRPSRVPAAVMALPALPPRDQQNGHPLVQLGLLHALRSSDAAARQRIRHRIAVTLAIELAAEAGVTPSHLLTRAFRPLHDDIQLGMPLLLGDATGRADAELAAAARAQREALEAMLPLLDAGSDAHRARALGRLARWSRSPVVAFTWSSATARALHHLLRDHAGIALLTGSTARIASGSISRSEVLRRLLPDARGLQAPRQDRVRLLITTDVISEGLSLSGVRTIIHLDLPWTMARIHQRTGRAARIGAPVSAVDVAHLPAPLPRTTYDTIDRLLARKDLAMRVMHTGAHHGAGDVAALLAPLAMRAHSCDQVRRRWGTLQHDSVAAPLIVAIVRLDDRRLLVALDADDTPRRPTGDDWHILARASPRTHMPGMRRRLRERLQQYLADRETTLRVTRNDDRRWQARIADDEMVLRRHAGARATTAASVSASRAAAMRITRPGELAALRDRVTPGSVEFTADASSPGPGATGVRIVCGVAIVPAPRPAGP
ncbi:MAG: DEAD/DEAH box helicase [Gemmatimonadaceae bacterium]|nr:DEAD/DEAH box helicase [Gemmatimonadaceae bacterium]